VGPEEPAPRAVEPLQRPPPPRRAHPGVPAEQLDRARHLAVHRRGDIELPSIYYAHEREVFERDGMLARRHPFPAGRDESFVATVRYRTVGDATCTGAVESRPHHRREVIAEVAPTRLTERGATRADDRSPRPRWKTASGGVLLMTELLRFATAARRRRQVHAHRAAALRLEAIFEDQLEAVAERRAARWGRVHQPRAAHRRPARRARAGHHHRRRLPLLSPRPPQVHHRRHPGHVQYTRNMVTGASTADLAHRAVDARKGVLEQSRRHAFIASLLRIPHLVLVRQQDGPRRLDQERFDEIVDEFRSSPPSSTSPT
jgi:hypothetical protein